MPEPAEPTTAPVQAWGPVQPGDTIILGFQGRISPQDARRVGERFEELIPDVTIIVLDNVADIAVYRPA
ncbi:MAG: hypothetical protein ACRDTZ_00950 [Pseudonocardiaceae bacterium]